MISSLLEFKFWSLYGMLALVKRCSSSITDNFSKLKLGSKLFLYDFAIATVPWLQKVLSLKHGLMVKISNPRFLNVFLTAAEEE